MQEKDITITRTLDELAITYTRFEHPPVYTMTDCTQYDNLAGINTTHCKNLFLCNRQVTEFFLLLIREDKKFRTAELSSQIGKSRLSFGKNEQLSEYLNVEPGAISPLGLLFDKGNAVTLLVDRDLCSAEKLCFHPNINTASIVMSMADFFGKFLPFTAHEPVFVTL